MKFGIFVFLLLIGQIGHATMAKIPITISTNSDDYSKTTYEELKRFIKDALEAANFSVSFYEVPPERAELLTSRGKFDCYLLGNTEIAKKYSNLITTSFPYGYDRIKIISKATTPIKRKQLRKLRGVIIAESPIFNLARRELLTIVGVESWESAIQMLLANRADYFLFNGISTNIKIQENPQIQKIIMVNKEDFSVIPLFLVLNNKLKSKVPSIDNALRSMLREHLDKYPLIKDDLNKDLK